MSLLSQFFPSGSSVISENQKIRTNILLVGGGGGGSPSPGCVATPVCAGAGGGGGGGGQVYQFTGYKIAPGTQITVTVGSGGAAASDGGSTSICSSSENISYTASGGNGNPTPITSANLGKYYNLCSKFPSGGGKGGVNQLCSTSTTTPLVQASCGGVTYCGVPFYAPAPFPGSIMCCYSTSITDAQESVCIIFGSPGAPATCIKNVSPGAFPGIGGHGGGGSISGGGNGTFGCNGPYPACNYSGQGSGCGGSGGSGYSTEVFGPLTYWGCGGGGGGGNYLPTSPVTAPICSGTCPPNVPVGGCRPVYGGLGGCSSHGGCGGCGGTGWCSCPATAGCDATANTGGGGGGGGFSVSCAATGGNGGSGVVIIQYPTTLSAVSAPARPGSTDCSPSTPGYYTYRYNGPGSITLP